MLKGKVLFPWDSSALAKRPLAVGITLARLLGTELVVFHVRLPIRASLVAAPDFVSPEDQVVEEQSYKDASEDAGQLCASCNEEGVKANWEIVSVDAAVERLAAFREQLQDIVAAEVLRRAAEPDIGLVVLGSHGASAPMGKSRGGVASRVAMQVSKPVLVVPLLP